MEHDKKTVEDLCDNVVSRIGELWDQNLGCMENGEVDDFAKEVIAAHKSELAEKDNEIANLESENGKLRSLVRKLATALGDEMEGACNSCGNRDCFVKRKFTCPQIANNRALVAEAMKVVSEDVDVLDSDDRIERIVRDAVQGYNEMFPSAPNDDCERELRERASWANAWLIAHGFEPEPFHYDAEQPCIELT